MSDNELNGPLLGNDLSGGTRLSDLVRAALRDDHYSFTIEDEAKALAEAHARFRSAAEVGGTIHIRRTVSDTKEKT